MVHGCEGNSFLWHLSYDPTKARLYSLTVTCVSLRYLVCIKMYGSCIKVVEFWTHVGITCILSAWHSAGDCTEQAANRFSHCSCQRLCVAFVS